VLEQHKDKNMEMKHVGRIKTNGKKCVVVFRTLPGDAYNCLVAPTENLPDSYHDALINLVESSGGQSSNEFGEVMARSQFPDGSVMLAALHTQGRLLKVSTDQIEMIPNSTTAIQLSELNQIIAEQQGVAVDALSLKSGITADPIKTPDVEIQEVGSVSEMAKETADVSKTTSSSALMEETVEQTPEAQAKRFRSEADRLAKQAAEMRRKAEELAPTKKAK
jgi:hypothetical protein